MYQLIFISLEDYESLLETTDVFFNPETMEKLELALKDEQDGRTWTRDRNGRWKKEKARLNISSRTIYRKQKQLK